MNRVKRRSPAPRPGIVHLGVGAFARSHLSIYTEDAVAHSGGDWGIVGVSMRSSTIRDALLEQQFAYSALQLNPDVSTVRQVEIISNVLVAPEAPEAVLEITSHPDIKIVSLTVTEKGYCLLPASGMLDNTHPDIVHDLNETLPLSAPGFLVRALQLRKQQGLPPFTVLSCDNLPDNGNVIRKVVLSLAEQLDSELAHWIEQYGCFPSTMVDRITPATTPADQQRIETLSSVFDAAPVVHEPFSQWVIEDEFCGDERPDWAIAGADLVNDVKPYEIMKLRMLNATHSALAYLGYLAGFRTIADTVTNVEFRAFTHLLWQKEIIPELNAPPGVSLADYASSLMERYTNPAVQHLNWQIAMDGSQKLPQRILGTVDDRFTRGADAPGLILVIAGWMRYVNGVDDVGDSIDVRDPLTNTFASLRKSNTCPENWVSSMLTLDDVFPATLARQLAEPVTQAYCGLVTHGAHTMVRNVLRDYAK